MNKNINISGVSGDVIGVGVEGVGHTFGKNITVGTININANQLKKMPSEYAKSLENFSKSVNEQLKINKIPQENIQAAGRRAFNPYNNMLQLQGLINGFQPFMLGIAIQGQQNNGYFGMGSDGFGYFLAMT